jgi:diguanylate cyclase (GGDEF)-like protein
MRSPVRTPSENDPALLKKLAFIERGYLAVVALISLCALAVRYMPALTHSLPGDWALVSPPIAIAALLSSLGLEFCRASQPRPVQYVGAALALLLTFLAGAALLGDLLRIPLLQTITGSFGGSEMPVHTAATFAVLGIVMLLTPARKNVASHAADLVLAFFCLLVLVMIRDYLLEGLAGLPAEQRTSLFTLLALALLAFVAFMHRAENGAFSTLLGAGSGSKIARFAAPVVLLVPFLPQSALTDAVKSGLIHPGQVSAAIAFIAAGISLVVMLSMALKINRLEEKIRDLALRDEATELHNRRGFELVAWQALRQARRDGLPFSILFVSLDNLAEVTESLGPQTTAEMLAEIADILRAAFRATDVIGRVDPAQFAVAGHFDEKAGKIMRLRLREAVNYRNSNPGRTYSLATTVSSVHARDPRTDTLEELMTEADVARDPESALSDTAAKAASNEAR